MSIKNSFIKLVLIVVISVISVATANAQYYTPPPDPYYPPPDPYYPPPDPYYPPPDPYYPPDPEPYYPPPPTPTPTPAIANPVDLVATSLVLTDASGNTKNTFLPGGTAFVKVSVTNTGNDWPRRSYLGTNSIMSLEGKFYKNVSSSFYRTPESQISGLTADISFITDTAWNGDDYSPSTATRTWGSYTGGPRRSDFSTYSFQVPTTPGTYTARFIIDPTDRLMESWSIGPLDSTCTNTWCKANFATNQDSFSYTVLGGDLVIDELILVDQNGIERGTATNPFLESDSIYPRVTIRNNSTGAAISPDDHTDSRLYAQSSSQPTSETPPTLTMLNGEFQAGDSYTYYCRPNEPNNRCWAFNNGQYWNQTTGTHRAWIWVNFNRQANETNYSNNTRTRDYIVVPSYDISGRVFIDNNRNNTYNNGEGGIPDVKVTLHTSEGIQLQSKITNSSGIYKFDPVIQENYQVRIFSDSSLADYTITTPSTIDVMVGPDSSNNNFATFPKYSLSGLIFIDENGDRVKNTNEQNFKKTPELIISPSGGPINITTSNDGTYSIIGLISRTYTISYSSLPTGYFVSHPRNGPPPTFSATVGSGCTEATPLPGGSCSNGSLQNLNFGIKEGEPWIQAYGLDVRFDTGVNNPIPPSPNAACGGAYMMRPATSSIPGIFFTGNITTRFGEGQSAANPFNWIVGGTMYPEIFTPVNKNIIKTAYGAMQTSLRQSNQSAINLSTICTLTNCVLPPNLPEGVYQATQDVALQGYTFPSGRDYVFLIDGDLTIWGNLDVPTGSTATYSTSGDIRVVASVGQAAPSCPAPANAQIEGLFSADKNFQIASNADCAANQPDKQLHIQGAIVVNAGQLGGRFINDRTLCASNVSFPTFTMRERPDMILNAPDLIRSQNVIYQEIAP